MCYRIGKLLLFGAIFCCVDSTLTIAACLSYKSPFVAPFAKKEQADIRKREFAVGNSDQLTVLRAYKVQ
jgi:ATP-dependent RNA helicase DHX57